jgi:quercetin dioxygenase-like cupin family protein
MLSREGTVKHIRKNERTPQPVSVEGASGLSKAGLLGEADGAPTAAMRVFDVAPGGNTPWHAHDWEHVVYILEGSGILLTEGGEEEFEAGDSILVEPDEPHNFVNRGDVPVRFLCIVPLRGDA